MKILWVNQYFLHPTERGGQIRSMGILKPLHERHEVHYAALDDPSNSMGRELAHTYSSRSFPVSHPVVSRRSLRAVPQVAANMFASALPLAVSRYASPALRATVSELIAREQYDAVVCDFAASGVNMPTLEGAVLFQHNVETTIFERHAEHASTPLHRWFYQMQARRMRSYEASVCRSSAHVIAVSPIDAQRMRDMFGITHVSDVPTGVDVDSLRNSRTVAPTTDMVFVGSMDWLPNVDGMLWFAAEILPLIRREKPDCSVTIVGRRPDPAVMALATADPLITVTGTIPDVRPHLWSSRLSVLPLRIGGGTRMKVYEAMAAEVPMVSTSIGMEGLACVAGRDIIVADTPSDFARECIALLDDPQRGRAIAASALQLVEEHCSWDAVSRDFEAVLLEVAERKQREATR